MGVGRLGPSVVFEASRQQIVYSMNIKQTVNAGLLVVAVSALLSGFTGLDYAPDEIPATIWLFVGFYVLLRLKTFLDDHAYFGKAASGNPHFRIGFVLAIISWLAWAVSGYMLADLQDAYFVLGVALTISTLWIVIDALREGASREQYYWLLTNALYILLLWMLYKRNQPSGDWVTIVILGSLIGLVAVDCFVSRSFEHLEE